MLVLGRKAGEEVHIGGGIRIKIVKLDGGTVRLGIEAPREIAVERAELRLSHRTRNRRCRARGVRLAPAA